MIYNVSFIGSHVNSASLITSITQLVRSYSQEYPKRFQKDIVKVASNITSRQLNSSPVNSVSAHGIEHVLHNIGAGHKMSRSEILSIVTEVGACPIGTEEDCVITADQMLDLISTKWAEHHHELNQ